MQIIGTLFGAVINYILMTIITENQREILLSIRKYHSSPLPLRQYLHFGMFQNVSP